MKSSFFKSATSICAVSAGASLMYDTMPLFLGRAADSLQLDEAQMGTMGSIYLLAMTLGAASGVLWVKRTNWRWVIHLAFGLTSGLFFAYGLTEKFFVVLALQALIGSLMGMVLAVGFAAAAQTPEPDRVYGFKNAAEIGLSALVMLLVPWFASDLVALAATFAVLLVLLTLFTGWLPECSEEALTENKTVEENSGNPYVWVALTGLIIHFGATTGVWAFLERIGVQSGLSQEVVGTIIGLSLIVGVGGSVAAGIVGDRYGRIIPMLVGNVPLLAGVMCFALGESSQTYIVGMLLFNFAWNYFIPYQWGLIAELDSDGRLVTLIATAMGLGAAIGPALVGMLITQIGYMTAYLIIGLGVLVGLVFYIVAVAAQHKEKPLNSIKQLA